MEETALATTLTGIGDTGLREALDALGRAVKGLHGPSNPAK
jgi:hypothetical protein